MMEIRDIGLGGGRMHSVGAGIQNDGVFHELGTPISEAP